MESRNSDLDNQIDRLLVRHKAKTDMIQIIKREAEEIARKIKRLEARSQRGGL